MKRIIVRYRVKPEFVAENEHLIGAVFAENIKARCDEPPVAAEQTPVGLYRFLDA